MKESEIVYLSLGTNLGDRASVLRNAFRELSRFMEETCISRFYESDPMYFVDQPAFLNAVVRGVTSLQPLELLHAVNGTEASFGRKRDNAIPKGPRPLDIDILLFGEHVLDTPRLGIPHRGMRERKFVLLPLLELNPYLREPGTGEPYFRYLEKLPPQGIYYSSLNEYTAIFNRQNNERE